MIWNWEHLNQHLDFPSIDSMHIQHCRVSLKLVLQESLTSLQHIHDCFLKFLGHFSIFESL